MYHKRMLRYSQFIFNDHFILVLFLFLGFLGYFYSQYVTQVPPGDQLAIFIIFFLAWFVTQSGSLANFLTYADRVYLLPKELEIKQTLKKSLLRSFIVYAIILCFFIGALAPLIQKVLGYDTTDIFILGGVLLSTKVINLISQILNWLQKSKSFDWRAASWLISALVLLLAVMINNHLAFILSLFVAAGSYLYIKHQINSDIIRLNWQKAISDEASRMHRIDRRLSLFTDVPGVSSSVKRLRFLDPFLQILTRHTNSAQYFYLWRIFIRDSHYLNLWLRLTIIGLLLISLSSSMVISFGFSLLFILMTGYQLLPMINDLKKQLFFNIYPLLPKSYLQAAKPMIYQVLGVQLLIFQCVLTLKESMAAGIIGLCLDVFVLILFTEVYVTKQLQKVFEE